MNNFCKMCQHRLVPKKIKDIFNANVFIAFVDCPKRDIKICGCTVKYLDIDWKKFIQYLNRENKITKEDLEYLKNKGVV